MYDILFETNICPYLPKLYGIYKSFDEIDFSSLPKSFVIKTNHDCGGVVIVPNKDSFLNDTIRFNEAKVKLTKHLHTNYYSLYREYHYKDIEPRIFIEELLGEINSQNSDKCKVVDNYRIFTFAYNADIFIQVDDAEYWDTQKRWFYNADWEFQSFSYNMPILYDEIARPATLEKMKNISIELTCKEWGFVRVDLYEFDSKVFVGELTLTPCGGIGKWSDNWDKKLGNLWRVD